MIFEKRPFAISLQFSPFRHKQPFIFSDVLNKDNNSLFCIPIIMINFDVVDLSKGGSEEVISIFEAQCMKSA